MRSVTKGVALCLLLALCPSGSVAAQERLTVYSSLPLSGASRSQSEALVRGARLALDEAGGMAGTHALRYVSLDDATDRAGTWTPEKTSRNARRAARDASTIAYIGEFNSGATAVSLPILNEAGIAQISPTNTATGITRGGPGTSPGEPAKYYPQGPGSYFRLTPNDRVMGGALAAAMRARGCRRVALLSDAQLYGRGVRASARRHARGLGMTVVATRAIVRRARSHRRLARRLRSARTDCVAFSGIAANGAVRLFRDLARTLPRAKLFGSDGIADPAFADRREGGVPRSVARRVRIILPTFAPTAFPSAGRAVLQRYAERYGDPFPDPRAVHGYEAMRLIIEAVAAAGPNRGGVIRWLRTMPERDGALGTYRFDAFGDTTLRTFGVCRIVRGQLVYAGTVDAP